MAIMKIKLYDTFTQFKLILQHKYCGIIEHTQAQHDAIKKILTNGNVLNPFKKVVFVLYKNTIKKKGMDKKRSLISNNITAKNNEAKRLTILQTKIKLLFFSTHIDCMSLKLFIFSWDEYCKEYPNKVEKKAKDK